MFISKQKLKFIEERIKVMEEDWYNIRRALSEKASGGHVSDLESELRGVQEQIRDATNLAFLTPGGGERKASVKELVQQIIAFLNLQIIFHDPQPERVRVAMRRVAPPTPPADAGKQTDEKGGE